MRYWLTYVHTYIHAHIHTYVNVCICMVFHPGTLKRSEFDFPYIHIYIHTCTYIPLLGGPWTVSSRRMWANRRHLPREWQRFCVLQKGNVKVCVTPISSVICRLAVPAILRKRWAWQLVWGLHTSATQWLGKRTYTHTYIHSYIHRNLQTQPCVGQNELWKMWDSPMRLKMQVHTYVHAYVHTYLCSNVHTYTYVHMYTYIHTQIFYIHACMHTCIHT